MVICSICKLSGHNARNKKYHPDTEFSVSSEISEALETSDVYKKISEQTYKSKPISKISKINNYSLIKYDSENVAYKKGRNIIIGIRGTYSLEDVFTDMEIIFGKDITNLDRYKRSKQFLLEIKDLYPDCIIHLTAHSLGGIIANKLSKEYNLKSEVFNPFLCYDKKSDLVKINRNLFDIVSLPQTFEKDTKTTFNGFPKKIKDLLKFHSLKHI